jgi:hypothetical protein
MALPARTSRFDRFMLHRAALAGQFLAAALLGGLACFACAQAQQAHKQALVIGNARYADAPLRNPENDARDIARALRALDFKVTLLLNADRSTMLAAAAEHARRLTPQSLSVLYFGGHGVQAAGRNFLLPILQSAGAVRDARELETAAVALESLMLPLAAARPRFNVVVLDACRDNPFGDGRLPGGLAPLEAPPNTLLAFATSPGKLAFDGEGSNGTYTAHLLRHLPRRELRIEEMFKLVRAGVLEESRGRQLPWENTALTGELSLAQFPQLPGAVRAGDSAAVAWIRDAGEADLRRYLAENRDAHMRMLVVRQLVALREKTPLRGAALALAERPCESCPRMRALEGLGPVPLWAASDLITAADLRRCVAARACSAPPDLALAADYEPAQGVSHAIAEQYVAWLNAEHGAEHRAQRGAPAWRFFLPDEAQWRATYRASFFREDGRPLFQRDSACRVANLYDESAAGVHRFGWRPLGCNDGFAEASPVGLFLPSALGLFDLVGNVWQWTSSCAESEGGRCRAYRLMGGSWATGGHWSWAEPPQLAAEPDLAAPIFGLRVFATRGR